MAGTKEIKRRIKSIKNTKKITKAMELVAASKMKHAISSTLASRPYSGYSWEVLRALSEYIAKSTHSLFETREQKKILVILITSNRGLCGGYNAQVAKSVIANLKENTEKTVDFISIGKKGDAMLRRIKQNIIASFNNISEKPRLSEIMPIINMATELYEKKEYDGVFVGFTDFISAISQKARIEQLLPVEKSKTLSEIKEMEAKEKGIKNDYIFEPDYESLMNVIVGKIVRTKFYQMILESNASEQSSRMMAMKNASEASEEMIDGLTLEFNKARQANITKEISEISAGMATVN